MYIRINMMDSRMIRAGVALCMFFTTASSNCCHLQRYMPIAIAVHTAEAVMSESWLPPAMASPPNNFMVRAKNITSTARGTNDIISEGCFVEDVLLLIIVLFIRRKDTQNLVNGD